MLSSNTKKTWCNTWCDTETNHDKQLPQTNSSSSNSSSNSNSNSNNNNNINNIQIQIPPKKTYSSMAPAPSNHLSLHAHQFVEANRLETCVSVVFNRVGGSNHYRNLGSFWNQPKYLHCEKGLQPKSPTNLLILIFCHVWRRWVRSISRSILVNSDLPAFQELHSFTWDLPNLWNKPHAEFTYPLPPKKWCAPSTASAHLESSDTAAA